MDRTNKSRSPLGTAVFLGSRFADPFLQYSILSNGPISSLITRLGGSVLAQGPALVTATPLDSMVGLSPYRSILLAMSVGSMIKHNFWILAISREHMGPAAGAFVGVFNAVVNSANSLMFICSQTSASVNGEHFPQTPLIVGASLYAAGLFVETFSELQRDAFKKDRRNAGRVYEGGLFSLSRHVNYFGYVLWRVGFATAAGGWLYGAAQAAWFSYFFSTISIPELQNYLEVKYGAQYEHYKQATPYKLIPYIY